MVGKPVKEWQQVNIGQLLKDRDLYALFPDKACRLLCVRCGCNAHRMSVYAGMASHQFAPKDGNGHQEADGWWRQERLCVYGPQGVFAKLLSGVCQGQSRS